MAAPHKGDSSPGSAADEADDQAAADGTRYFRLRLRRITQEAANSFGGSAMERAVSADMQQFAKVPAPHALPLGRNRQAACRESNAGAAGGARTADRLGSSELQSHRGEDGPLLQAGHKVAPAGDAGPYWAAH